MKWFTATIILPLIFFLIFLFLVPLFKSINAVNYGTVNSTVNLSICGNQISEMGEDCDAPDLTGRTCSNLGYLDGTLSCDPSCTYNTSLCPIPLLNPSHLSADQISSLLASGLFTIPSTASIVATSFVTVTQDINIVIPSTNGDFTIFLPAGLVITTANGSNFDPTNLSASEVLPAYLSGLSAGTVFDVGMFWGIPSTTLEFSSPITIRLRIGAINNEKIVDIVRSNNATSGWSNDGLVSPANCKVINNVCTFQSIKSGYFATTHYPFPTPTQSPSTSTASSTSVSVSTNIEPTPTVVPFLNIPLLPEALKIFDVGGLGKIRLADLGITIKMWVTSWKKYLLADLGYNSSSSPTKYICDINIDGTCNLRDLSILLYYIER